MKSGHWSDCAVHNAPALPVGVCDCGGLDLADNAGHGLVATLEAFPGGVGGFVENCECACLVEPQQLPTNRLVVNASTSHLPDPHNGIAVPGQAASVDLNVPSVPIIPNLK